MCVSLISINTDSDIKIRHPLLAASVSSSRFGVFIAVVYLFLYFASQSSLVRQSYDSRMARVINLGQHPSSKNFSPLF